VGQAAHFPALCHQRSEVADRRRRYPDAREQACRMELGKRERGFGIGLDGNPCDQGHVRGMNQRHRVNQRLQLIMDLERVRRHLEHDGVRRGQLLLAPGRKVGVGDTLRAEDEPLLGVDTDGNQILLVNVEPNVAVRSAS